MNGRERYEIGEKIRHAVFGNGLVVEVRDRGFYDVIEVAFEAGVKRLTSIHPDILGRIDPVRIAAARPGEAVTAGGATAATLAPPEPGDGSGERSGNGDRGAAPRGGKHRRAAASDRRQRLAIGGWSAFQHARIRLDPATRRLLARYRRGRRDDHRAVRLRVKAEELTAHLDPSELLAFDLARDVVRYEHQIAACRRVIGEMHGRALLADEVGLGKTIEAGIVLSELVIRGLVQRTLILVPASLQIQWQDELRHKFGLRFHIRQRGEGFATHDDLITTLDTARIKRNQAEILERSYDLVIIDEAHRLKNHRTLSYGFASTLAARYLLLLTATPVHNDLRELYNLVTLLRPGTLGTYTQFRKRYVARGDRRIPRNTQELSRELAQVMIRTRREDTNIQFPARRAETLLIEPAAAEAALYARVSAFVRSALHDPALQGTSGWHLALLTLQKEIGSSPRAAVSTLHKLARRCPQPPMRRAALALAEQAQSVADSAKLRRLIEIIDSTPDKILLFTQFRGTLRFLAQNLEQRGLAIETFHGGLSESQREEAIHRFRRRGRLLISTDAGGEGRNLQFCHRMVNYDLPWNPMKVEQRIGRVHRLGQDHDVDVHSFIARGTVESHVLQLLHVKLRMFELVVGELDMILGHVPEATSIEDAVFKLWMLADEEEREAGFRRLGDELENARLRYEMIDALDRSIFESIRRGVD